MNLSEKVYKKRRLFIPIIGVLIVIFLAGCTSSTESAEFPIGLLECDECQGITTRYFDDGTLIVYLRGYEYIHGKWSVEDNIFYTGDSFCSDEDEMPGSYKWRFDGEILTLRVIKDECSDRVDSLDRKPWRLIEDKK